jgi:hypothetical protein
VAINYNNNSNEVIVIEGSEEEVEEEVVEEEVEQEVEQMHYVRQRQTARKRLWAWQPPKRSRHD